MRCSHSRYSQHGTVSPSCHHLQSYVIKYDSDAVTRKRANVRLANAVWSARIIGKPATVVYRSYPVSRQVYTPIPLYGRLVITD
jgi:hypothetical protein